MIELQLPKINAKIREVAGKEQIFDIIRKKYVALTPEEWVRQHVVSFLIEHRNYPKGLIKVESGLTFNKMKKRSDIIIYNQEGNPFLIVECKAASQSINQSTIDQASIYAFSLQSNYLVVSNGMQHHCCQLDFVKKEYSFCADIPFYDMSF